MSRKAAIIAAVFVLLLLLIPLKSRISSIVEHPADSLTAEREGEAISLYDDIIKAASDSAGLDWRLVAAVIYTESRFNNQASSHKGAVGLMQVLSNRYSTEYLLDPQSNLRVGTRYLSRLQKMYSGVAASPTESLKFALAAYNYGEAKVWRLIRETKAAGEDQSRWDVVSTHLPPGHHTVSYVKKVMEKYSEYYRLY